MIVLLLLPNNTMVMCVPCSATSVVDIYCDLFGQVVGRNKLLSHVSMYPVRLPKVVELKAYSFSNSHTAARSSIEVMLDLEGFNTRDQDDCPFHVWRWYTYGNNNTKWKFVLSNYTIYWKCKLQIAPECKLDYQGTIRIQFICNKPIISKHSEIRIRQSEPIISLLVSNVLFFPGKSKLSHCE